MRVGKPQASFVLCIRGADAEVLMSGDSLPLPLPLARFAADSCEATTLYRELREPLAAISSMSRALG